MQEKLNELINQAAIGWAIRFKKSAAIGSFLRVHGGLIDGLTWDCHAMRFAGEYSKIL